ncbi:MAG: hypothetical protein JWL73_1983, partial [Actinomycetia bacterium]|nr:hypothetical protein [Actinomycetes bacterium]
ITAELTEGLDAEDDRVIRTVERVKRVCWENNLVLWCNTGYGFPSVEDMRDRGRALADRGANLILFQSAEFILTNSLKWLRRELS